MRFISAILSFQSTHEFKCFFRWDEVILSIAKTFGVKLVTPAEWLKALAKADDITKNPALKLLPFYQLKATKMEQHGDTGSHEAFGLPRLQTIKSERLSHTLANLDKISEADVNKWLDYWTKQNFLSRNAVVIN